VSLELLDKLVAERGIRSLVSRYAQHADDNDYDGWVALFADDASLDTGREQVTGVAGLRTWLHSVQSDNPMRHLVSDVDIAVESLTAAPGVMDLLLLAGSEGRWAVLGTMRYIDRYVRVDGEWRFSARAIELRRPPG